MFFSVISFFRCVPFSRKKILCLYIGFCRPKKYKFGLAKFSCVLTTQPVFQNSKSLQSIECFHCLSLRCFEEPQNIIRFNFPNSGSSKATCMICRSFAPVIGSGRGWVFQVIRLPWRQLAGDQPPADFSVYDILKKTRIFRFFVSMCCESLRVIVCFLQTFCGVFFLKFCFLVSSQSTRHPTREFGFYLFRLPNV